MQWGACFFDKSGHKSCKSISKPFYDIFDIHFLLYLLHKLNIKTLEEYIESEYFYTILRIIYFIRD